MKKIIFLSLLLPFLLAKSGFSQDFYRSEFGLFLGGSYYLGDLNPSKHFLQTQPAGGLIYRYNITPRWAFKMSALLGWLKASDARSKANVERNLSFRSYIFDFSTQIEFNFLPYITGHDKFFITPYIFVGASVFNFSPQANYNGTWYNLQPLGTEGQGTTIEDTRKPYALTTISIPFGLGLKYSPHQAVSLGLEYGIRKTFTDYIDDVSTRYANPVILAAENGPMAATLADRRIAPEGEVLPDPTGLERGNSRTKDWYVYTGLTITIRIKPQTKRCPAYKQHPRVKIKYRD